MTPCPIHSSYVICTTPRSGSNFLCEVLQATGVAGKPDEYFWDPPAGHERWTLDEWSAYVEQIRRAGTTPNGVFGVKVMWGYFGETVSRLAALIDRAAANPPEILAATFPDVRYVWLTRRDRIRQGISWYRAMKSERWRSTDPAIEHAPEPAFDFEAIDHLVTIAADDDRSWQDFFGRHGIEPLVIVYEELAQDHDRTCRQILDFLHLPVPQPFQVSAPPPSSFPAWRHQRQADTLTDDWVRQYHAMKGTTPA